MTYRTDIDGLRALAVLAVVLYHCSVPGFGWGFTGVDVFFVISGYLISTILWHEVETHGRPRLARFWSRRVRRLLPASSVVLFATAIASAFLLSPIRLKVVGAAVGATSAYSSNLFFGWMSNDYFRADLVQSPLLHTWSLAVEEQFYFVWPLVFALPHAMGLNRRSLIAVLWVFGAASFGLSTYLTLEGSSWAFYAMPSRAWQFAAGGILALTTLRSPPRGAVAALAVAGAIAAAIPLLVAHGVPYPGWRALLPTAATLLVLYAAPAVAPVHAALSSGPARWLGARSYGWYLWHWPPLILIGDWVHTVPTSWKVAIGVLTLGLADLSYRTVENPVRRLPALQDNPRRNFAMAFALALMGFASGAAVIGYGGIRERSPEVQHWVRQTIRSAPTNCGPLKAERGTPCWIGDPSSDRVVLLMGDSHAAHWRVAFDAAAKELGISVLLATHEGCPAIPLPGAQHTTARCSAHRVRTMQAIETLNLEAVVLSQNHAYVKDTATDPTSAIGEWRHNLTAMSDRLAARDLPFAVLQDMPYPTLRPEYCVTSHPDVASCTIPAATLGLMRQVHAMEREAVGPQDAVFDPTVALCDDTGCPVTVGDTLVYRDQHHISDGYALTRAPDLADFLREVLQR